MKIRTEIKNGRAHDFQKTGMRCQSCDTPFSVEMEVCVPVNIYVKQMKAVRCPRCGSDKLYLGMNLGLSEDRAIRLQQGTILERLQDWDENGESGASSRYLAYCLSGLEWLRTDPAYPHDYDDLRRVILLVDRVPEFQTKMDRMVGEKGWEKIAAQWEEIVDAVLKADPEARSPKSAQNVLSEIYYQGR